MDQSLERILFIPDTHAPFHDRRAFRLMLEVADYFDFDYVVVLGDFYDFYCVSAHSKDPNRKNTLDKELQEAWGMLEDIALTNEDARLIYVAGNHEERLERYLAAHAPELYNIVTIPNLLALENQGWEYVPYRDETMIGKLHLTHDTGRHGKHAVYNSVQDYQHNVVIGHVHKVGLIVDGNVAGENHVGACFGWLGDAEKADYMHRVKAIRDFHLGFGVGYKEKRTGNVWLSPLPIINYTVVVEGKRFKRRK